MFHIQHKVSLGRYWSIVWRIFSNQYNSLIWVFGDGCWLGNVTASRLLQIVDNNILDRSISDDVEDVARTKKDGFFRGEPVRISNLRNGQMTIEHVLSRFICAWSIVNSAHRTNINKHLSEKLCRCLSHIYMLWLDCVFNNLSSIVNRKQQATSIMNTLTFSDLECVQATTGRNHCLPQLVRMRCEFDWRESNAFLEELVFCFDDRGEIDGIPASTRLQSSLQWQGDYWGKDRSGIVLIF